MAIHFRFLALIYSLSLIYRILRDKNKKNARFILIGILVLLVGFLGLRDISIGTDTYTYVYLFTSNSTSYSNFEILLPIISHIIHLFTNKYFVYLSVLAFFAMFGIYKTAKDYDFDTEYFFFLYITSYCFLYSASAIRFFCAFSIIMMTFKYMIKKDTKKVILMTLLACLFHTTAIIFIPFYFLTKFKLNKRNYIMFSICLILIILFEKFAGSGFLFNLSIFEKYKYVINNQNGIGGLSTLMNFGILFLALIYYNSIKIYKEEYEFFIKMHTIGIALDYIGTAYRVIWYFRFPIWFLLPIILKNLKQKKSKDYVIIYVVFIVIYLIIYYYLLLHSYSSNNFLYYIFNKYLK